VEFTNTTASTVQYHINGGDGLNASLPPGKTARVKVVVTPGVTPAITLKQPGGKTKKFSLKDGDKYAFRMENGEIINSYK